jgi:outer membrane protein assembly factor BamB
MRNSAIVILLVATIGSAAETDWVNQAVKYLAAEGAGREAAAAAIAKHSGAIGPIVSRLERAEPKKHDAVRGSIFDEHFSRPDLRERHRDDLLNFLVPESYAPWKKFGLLIFMHGGGPGTKREYARSVLSDPAKDRYSYGLRRHFTNSQFIVVAPSALWNEKSSARWNLPETDDYIDAVIRECRYRFNVDRERIFLGGHSMGGFGAYHLCQRLADRLAGGVLYAGAWKSARWENMVGTPLFIRHGRNDAVPAGMPGKSPRPRYTDVFYGSAASRLLTAAGAEHVYAEDEGGHSIKAAGESVERLVKWMGGQRREPYARRVIAQTPRGWNATRDTPTPHHRWVTILEAGDGTLPFDEVQRTGPGPSWKESRQSFLKQGFQLGRRNVRAAKVEAVNHGDNRLTVTTRNVRRFAIWLHPEMVDFARPVRISVNGADTIRQAKATLLDALRSYERRGDWGLIYHAEIRLAGDLAVAQAEPFPQWRGVNRDGIVTGFSVPDVWPKKLKEVWRLSVGGGYSGPISDGERVYLHSRIGEEEIVSCVRLTTGETVWLDSYAAAGRVHPAGAAHGLGPKSTPALKDGRLYTLGIGSILSCFDAVDGRLNWRKDFSSEFSRPAPSCGTSMSPLMVDDLCLVHVGVDRKGRMIAFDAKTGEERWSYDGDGPGYGSPIVATLDGTRQIIVPVSKFIAGLSVADGKLLWRVPFPTKSTQNILTPVVYRDRLIVGGIDQVTACLRPAGEVDVVWQNRDVPLHMSSPVLQGNRLYGMSSRNAGHLFCVNADTGKTIWQSEARMAQNAVVLHLGSHLGFLTDNGRLIFAKAGSARYEPVATYRVSPNGTWAHPLLVGRHIVIKDDDSLTGWAFE